MKNLYWTRLISLQSNQEAENERWPLAPDNIDCLNNLQEIDIEKPSESQILFDPLEFSRNNPAPSRQEYQLKDTKLEELMVKGSAIRA